MAIHRAILLLPRHSTGENGIGCDPSEIHVLIDLSLLLPIKFFSKQFVKRFIARLEIII